MHDCLIAFGSNQGDSESLFNKTLDLLQLESIELIASSKPKRTQPVGGPADQEDYLNAAIRIQTDLDPLQLHQVLIQIEQTLGRVREQRWGARKIDLDLIFFADQVIETKNLTVPHPRMSFRRFVLEPAEEVASDMVHPLSKRSIKELIQILDQDSKKILIVFSGDAEFQIANAVKCQIKSHPKWQIEASNKADDIREQPSKLTLVARFSSEVASSGRPDSNSELIYDVAKTFSGPTLELPLEPDRALEELVAAIDAMERH